jgi:hypothetical protein
MAVTEDQLAAWQKLCEDVTPGPWTCDRLAPDFTQVPEALVSYSSDGDYLNDANGKFISEARSALPALIEEVRRLRKTLQAPESCFEHAGNCCSDWCASCRDGLRGEYERASIRASFEREADRVKVMSISTRTELALLMIDYKQLQAERDRLREQSKREDQLHNDLVNENAALRAERDALRAALDKVK